MKKISLGLLALLLCAQIAAAQKVPVKEIVLDNGMRLLLVPRKGDPNIAAGWVARVGSVNERPGITGLSHLFEHMMFKGTHAVGTKDIAGNLKLIKEMDDVRAELRKEQESLILKARFGEISDAKDPKFRSARYKELLVKFEELTKREKELMVKDEFDRIYTTAGGSGMNAGTSNQEEVVNKTPIAIGNYLVGVMFASIGIVELVGREYLDAGLWLSLAATFAILGSEAKSWPQIPVWRKAAAVALLVVAIVLFVSRMAIDFST